jgi:hypothetical protein
MANEVMLCSGCGRENTIYENGDKAIWRNVKVQRGENGQPEVYDHGRWEDDGAWHGSSEGTFGCSNPDCEYNGSEVALRVIAKLKPRVDPETGEPEPGPPPVMPGQTSLEAA